MGFDIEEKKTNFLYADLFKPKPEENRDKKTSVIMSEWRSPSSNSWSASESSSSGSELDLSDGDFTAELSRQMVECMLHEEEEEERRNSSLTHSAPLHHQTFKYGSTNSNRRVMHHANRTPFVKLKSESPVGIWRGRRVTNYMQTRKREQKWRSGNTGSEMRAIFLGGSGSRYGSSGTGVFLPPVTTNDPVHQKNKSGVSTVLIPTRVLEALEHHFTRLSDSEALAPATSSHYVSPRPREEWVRSKGQGNKHTKLEMEVANKVDEIQILPNEWTY